MPATLYKTFNVTPGTLISENIVHALPLIQGANPSPPAWFEWVFSTNVVFWNGTYWEIINAFTFTAPQSPGQFIIYFQDPMEGRFGARTYKIVINVEVADFEVYENCCQTDQNPHRNIAWYNIQGGWQNYIFTGVKTFRVEVGDNSDFKTNDYVSKHQSIDGVFDGELITSGDIPKSHVDYINGLKYSIQVFLFNTETNNWDIPILINPESFTKYKTRDKFFDVKLKFIYATEILVQSQ